MLRMRDFGDCETLDVVAAPGEQANDAGENARLIVDEHRQSVRLDVRFAERR
jgi:hypothetical protein